MKLKYILLFSLAVILLFIYGCSKEPTPVVETTQPVAPVVPNITTIPSCDDVDSCTDDLFNQLTQECEHKKLDRCCGDGLCDVSERCNYTIHTTVCPDDCPRECPAFVQVSDFGCEGNCYKTKDYFVVDGNTVFKSKLENIGELPLGSILSGFTCFRLGSSSTYYEDGYDNVRDGIKMNGHFNEDNEDTIFLTGKTFLQNTVNYYLEITGDPDDDVELSCTIRFTSDDFYQGKELRINLVKIQ